MTNNKRDSDGQPIEKRTRSDLLDELWEKIISKLTLKDNIRASAVSKRFLAFATLVQKTDKPPLLVRIPEYGDSYEFFDPFNNKSYWLDLPELRGARFHNSKDGWLLMSNFQSNSFFLFRPDTRELIQLPSLSSPIRLFTFSAAPTSPNCMVFAVDCIFTGTIQISTCRPGDTKWTKVNYQITIPLGPTIWENLIFCKGLLYCFNFCGLTVIYNPKESSWTVRDIRVPNPKFFFGDCWWKKEFMVEPNGDIIQVFTFIDRSPVILKLDIPNRTWVKMETLGGNALFLSDLSSHVRTDLLGNKRNNVYLSKVDFDENSCISYSFDEGRFIPKSYNWPWADLIESIWIDAPEDLSTFK